MTWTGFSFDHESSRSSNQRRRAHGTSILVEAKKLHVKTMTGCGLLYTLLVWLPFFALCVLLSALSLTLLLLGVPM